MIAGGVVKRVPTVRIPYTVYRISILKLDLIYDPRPHGSATFRIYYFHISRSQIGLRFVGKYSGAGPKAQHNRN